MKNVREVVSVALLCAASLAVQAQQPWEQALQKRHDQLVADNGTGTDAALRTKLLAMRDEDQGARFRNSKDVGEKKQADAHELHELDAKLTTELKGIVARHGWPTIAMVGIEASNGAMLVLTHSPDHAWQRALLPQLETLAQQDKIDGSPLATVVDKQLVAAGKPQRYGTQFKFVDGEAMMFAVEDPAGLGARREELMLPPMPEYRKALGEMYHLTVSDVIIRPDAAN